LLPEITRVDSKTLKRGQTNLHIGFMITALPSNNISYTTDEDKKKLPNNEFHCECGAIGRIGGMNDLRAKHILIPIAKLADRIFHSWPIKLKK
jgi:hypothetical protein